MIDYPNSTKAKKLFNKILFSFKCWIFIIILKNKHCKIAFIRYIK